MADVLTRDHFQYLNKKRLALQEQLNDIKDRVAGKTASMARSVTVQASTFFAGVANGKSGPEGLHVHGVPVDLSIGLVTMLLGYFDYGGDSAIDVADGLIASYTNNLGVRVGDRWRSSGPLFASSKEPAALPPGGAAPPSVSAGISPHQMADIVARVRGAARHDHP